MKLKIVHIFLFFQCALIVSSQGFKPAAFKLGKTFDLIDAYYVDTIDIDAVAEKAVIDILKGLDPHSTYISAEDVKEMNQPLKGNFEGIGIKFNLLRDTIIVVEPLSGGPSEKVGLKAGDRIVTIDGEKVTGIGLSNKGVRNRLMGDKGTKVNVSVLRPADKELMDFTINRDKIPINSLDAAYMIDKGIGYIKLNKFSAKTPDEFSEAVDSLKKDGMKNLILDLRGNGGGYMLAATEVVNNFFSDKNLIVYVSGRKTPRQDYKSNGKGSLSSARVVVLTDEQSASASEILAGAIQDWDRGVIIGRRTFGKGLVQQPFYLTDGSMIRLTIARYYTPSGRLIQSPYEDGYDNYMENFMKRYTDGELMTADSIHFTDSVKYNTLINKRPMHGGGGIMPDVFVAIDTTYNTAYFRKLAAKNVLSLFALEFSDKNRVMLASKYNSFKKYNRKFEFSSDDIKNLISEGEKSNVKYNEEQFNRSKPEILLVLKGLVASNMWQSDKYFQIINANDETLKKALEIISDSGAYNSLLGY